MMSLSNNHKWGLCLAFLVLALDQASKAWVAAHPQLFWPICPHLNFVYVINHGVTFGFLSDGSLWQRVLIAGATGGIFLWLIYQFKRTTAAFPIFCLGALLGGALGNVVDRVFRGGVIDFIDFYILYLRLPFYTLKNWHWPAFNLADTFIVLSVIGLSWFFIKNDRYP